MSLRTGPRLVLLYVVCGIALAVPRSGLACSVAKGDFDNNGTTDIRISGGTTRQNAVIELRGSGYRVQLDCNGNGTYTDGVDVEQSGADEIETYIVALGGADGIQISQTEALSGASKNIVAILNGGANKLSFKSDGFGIGGQSNLAFELRGGAGPDEFELDFSSSAIEDSLVVVRGDLGAGNNVGRVLGAGELANSVFDVSMVMGTGPNNNAAYSDGGGRVSNSTVNVRFIGNDVVNGNDAVRTFFSGKLENGSRVYVRADLGDGADKYFGKYDISSFGIDTEDPAAGSEMLVGVHLANGYDLATIDDMDKTGPAVINGALVQDIISGQQPDSGSFTWRGLTGSGVFAFRFDGGWGNEKFDSTVTLDDASTNRLLLLYQGNSEFDLSNSSADRLNVRVDAPAALSYAGLGAVVLDGGMQGWDTCNFTGTAKPITINCELGSW